MGAWGDGPFDNDEAADWCADLDEAEPAERGELVTAALAAAVEATDHLDVDVASRAIAAAALVAAQRPGAPMLDLVYAPRFLSAGVLLELGHDTRALALRALDAVAGPESEWRELWEASGNDDPAALLAPLRTALEAESATPSL